MISQSTESKSCPSSIESWRRFQCSGTNISTQYWDFFFWRGFRVDSRQREQRAPLITADSCFKHPQLGSWFSGSRCSLPTINPISVSSRRRCCCCCCCCCCSYCCRSCSCLSLLVGSRAADWRPPHRHFGHSAHPPGATVRDHVKLCSI